MRIAVAKLQRLVQLLPEGERRRYYEKHLRHALQSDSGQTHCRFHQRPSAPADSSAPQTPAPGSAEGHRPSSHLIWKGTAAEYRLALVHKEAELQLAKAQITGNARADWWVNNWIATLEPHIADLKQWLADAVSTSDGT